MANQSEPILTHDICVTVREQDKERSPNTNKTDN